jgi:hypothetical protein
MDASTLLLMTQVYDKGTVISTGAKWSGEIPQIFTEIQ